MIHAFCLGLLIATLAILDLRARRRTVEVLGAIGSLRSDLLPEPADRLTSGSAPPAEEGDEGDGLTFTAEFEGPEPDDPPVKVGVHLDSAELARVDRVHEAVHDAGDRPSGEREAYLPPAVDEDEGPEDDGPEGGAG